MARHVFHPFWRRCGLAWLLGPAAAGLLMAPAWAQNGATGTALVGPPISLISPATASDTGWSDKHRRLRDTLIELKSSYQARGRSGPAREQVGIVYLPVHAGKAGRL